MEPLRVFDSFQLDNLDQDWVKSIWDGQFLTFNDLPEEYNVHLETEDIGVLLKECYTITKTWISENVSSDTLEKPEVSWQTLLALNINPQSLVAVLGYIIKHGQSMDADEDSRQACLKATSLYFTLLSIPGSNAFHVFHPNLYHKAMETFKLSEHLIEKPKKSKNTCNLESLYINEDNEKNTLDHTEKVTLIRGLNCIMYDVIMMLKSFYMKDQTQTLEITVHSLLEVTKLETTVNHFDSNVRRNDASLASLSYNAYMALQELCVPKHGPTDVTIRLIAKYSLPLFLYNYVDLPPKALSLVRETTVDFLKILLRMHEDKAELGIATLIQHLMLQCPERVELRQKQATMLTKLINLCTDRMFAQAIDNLILLAHHSKVVYRVFAQEIIGKCLIEIPLDDDNSTGTDSLRKIKIKKLLIATVLSRCIDSSNMVRGKAMATLAECTDPENKVNVMMIQEIFESSSQDKPFPSLEELRKVITENVDPLPGSDTIISMLITRIDDERALTRRSALQTVRNLVAFSGLLNDITSVIGEHCRDPSMSVRRFAIQILTELLVQYPEQLDFLEKWVAAVVPQIFDIEIKVHEKALESVQDLTLNRISHVSNYINNASNNLPWQILNQLTKLKMRKHLSRACSIWEENGLITEILIENIESHLESDNNIAAWVLLSAITENRKLPSMKLHFKKYKELFQSNTFLATLKLEVLRNSWTSLDSDLLQELYSDLRERLCEFQVNFQFISLCLDILDGVAKHLHPNENEQFTQLIATDLMKLSEKRLEKMFQSQDDTAEGATTYLKIICTLGHASHLCAGTISSSTLRILQGLLLEWDSHPSGLGRTGELRAAAVVLLGQQAMRDREIAQEVTPILGRLMRCSTDANSKIEAAVRVNAAKALADLCIRFTALVEPYLADMCVCMKDPNPTVREVIVVLFIQLLLEDFIKVKGPFFFHILTMLSDTDEVVRELTVFLIKERLLVKNKTLILQQFIESIFHYNDYRPRNKFCDRRMHDREKNALTLPGRRNQEKRRMIYNFMLEHLDPPGKLKLLVKLTSAILGGVLADNIDCKVEGGACTLRDTLYIMTTEYLQPSSCAKHGDDDVQDDNTATPIAPHTSAANIIAEGMKRHRLEVLLPTLVKLKEKLITSQSALAVTVSKFFIKIISDYSTDQLSSLFNEYPNLEKEVDTYTRKHGKKALSDKEDTEEEDVSILVNNAVIQKTPISPLLVNTDRTPKLILRRLSSLTYPEISNWRSPSRRLISPIQLSQPGPSGNQRSLTSPSPNSLGTRSPQSEQGPSTSTPKSSRPNGSRRSFKHSFI